ncbi:MAG TPA: hypothetical protein DIT13_15550, partial [Verrucomicrobiales bacterium]|nr:hypothetical protein [Verrucomicrobiales bacterium]
YQFPLLTPGVYYIRIPNPPAYYPAVSANGVALDNGVNNDSNGTQPGGSGTAVVSPLITLSPGAEPGVAVDGDDTDTDSTVDFGFANPDVCYAANLFDNPSFEFQQLPNSTGTPATVLGYNGTGTGLGTGINAFQWVGGINSASGLGEPVQRVQLSAGSAGARVSWMESLKSRHGRRHLLLQGTNATASLRAAGGGDWSTVLQAGREYQLSVWAANASDATASLLWNVTANASIFQVITGPTPGLYQNYTVPQAEMTASLPGQQQCCGNSFTGTSMASFAPADYNGWSEAVENGAQPVWRQFTWRFRVTPTATATQINTAGFGIGAGSGSGPVVVDYVSLCQVDASNTLTLGNLVWNDLNNNGARDGAELGVGGVSVRLFTTTNNVAGDGDDVLLATTTTSVAGAYNFTNLAPGKYVIRFTPPAHLPLTGGVPATTDNHVNNQNKGSQPGGPGTDLISPVIILALGAGPVNDGDTDPDTNLTLDFGLWSGFTLGNQIWADTNSDGIFQSGSESGIAGVTVQLMDETAASVLATTTTNISGIYSFTRHQAGKYRIRIPAPPASFPLITAVNVLLDNGVDHDSNGSQPGGVGTAVLSPVITLAAATEPGSSGTTNIDNTLDFGFRACPAIAISPALLTAARQFSAYSVNLSATGGLAPYTWTVSTGALPDGLSLGAGGLLSGTLGAGAVPGLYNFTARAVDANGCQVERACSLTMQPPLIGISPPALPAGAQYAPYSQQLSASGGSAPYSWSVSPALPSGAVAWWIAENGAGDALGSHHGLGLNGLGYTNGPVGRAFNFDGVDDVAQVEDAAALKPAQITLEAWVNPAASGLPANGVILAKSAGSNGYGLGLNSGADNLAFWINDRAGNSITAALTPGVWSHVTATYDGTAMRLYVNGGLVASSAYSTTITHSSEPLRIGNLGGGAAAWKGGIDEAALYNRALTRSEE